ncbi:hypothetical protein CNMCM5793_004895 [Aspergillus hiratsukae]|uniref:F-box domain-containing protein n=1 Tax=Aspergillus hiratsukae TaxID=1194566 RepID=A0A8H6P0P6_9EURO|nr:hypothetical protein CNMCM5793_004895 [Aspergillus hiratsukae]
MSLVDLPTETLVQVFASLDSLTDAVNLSKTCTRFDHLLNDTWNMATIFEAIADNIVLPETPDAAWLETHFGPDCLWRPRRSKIARTISHAKTLEFLTTIGFPDHCIGLRGIDLQHFRKNVEQDKRVWPQRLHGPDGYTKGIYYPEAYYVLGCVGGHEVIAACKTGRISVQGIGWRRPEATSMISFLVILGTGVSSRDAIVEFIERTDDPFKLGLCVWFLETVYSKMKMYDKLLDKASRSWWDLLFDIADYPE